MTRFNKMSEAESHLRQVLGMEGQKKKSTTIEMGDLTDNSDAKKDKDMRIMCIDLSILPRTAQFMCLSCAVFFFYLIYGYLQEFIFRKEELRPHGWYLTLVQFGYYTLFGLVEMVLKGDTERRVPLQMYVFLAFLTVGTMGLSNASVGYLNYPTQVIFKCCKLIPVMLGGVLIQGKKYTVIDVLAVLLMVVGLILFTLADNSVSPTFNTYGVLLISLALCSDGAIGNFQEKALKQYKGGNTEMVLYSYSIGFVYILLGIIVTGEIIPAFTVCKQFPYEVYGYGMLFSLSGYLGLYVVLTLVKSFGALVAVTVTTCRKALTIILSFMFFAKPFTYTYVWSGLIVVVGIYLNVYSKNRSSWDVAISRWWQHIKQKLGLRSTHQMSSLASTVV